MKINLRIIIGLTIILLLFCWFQIRPSLIKSHCSWITYTEPAIPAFAGVTEEEARQKNDEEKNNPNSFTNSADSLTKLYFKSSLFTAQPPRPEIPERKVTRNASKYEYDICLKHWGI